MDRLDFLKRATGLIVGATLLGKLPLPVEAAAAAEASVPVGTMQFFAADGVSPGYLVCDGRAVSKREYAKLFQVIQDTYGPGRAASSNADEFVLPDFRGRVRTLLTSSDTRELPPGRIPAHTHSISLPYESLPLPQVLIRAA